MHNHHTKKRTSRKNRLVAHTNGEFSYRIAGHWTRRVKELPSEAYLSLLSRDRERLVLAEFRTGRSVTGSPVIVCRPKQVEVL